MTPVVPCQGTVTVRGIEPEQCSKKPVVLYRALKRDPIMLGIQYDN